jgi:hydrophobe/amphiphile efflux-3 (HAE3) family protein
LKTLVNILGAAVKRGPWFVVIVTIVISLGLGSLSSRFQPEDDGNESFAPDAPELLATDRINGLFGDDTAEAVMQVIISSESGDVVTSDGLAAVAAIEQTVRGGVFAEAGVLADRPDEQRPAVISYLFPVEFAVAEGHVTPDMSDQQLKLVYEQALTEMPSEQAEFAAGLLPTDVNPNAAISDLGLMIIFIQGPESSEEFDQFVRVSADAAAEIRETSLPDGIAAEPFAFELLFADEEDFQTEIARMLAAAAFIILTVLAIVFYVAPRRSQGRTFGVGGFGALIAITTLFVLEVVNALAVLAIFGLVFLLWTLLSKNLRRTTADTLVTIVTIFFAISWMSGIGYLLFGSQNPMVQIIPILLIGLGVDYSIHVTTRYREEVASGRGVDESISVAISTVGIALVLATVTTAVGFLTNLVSDIPALREFGVLAAIGITASFVLMLTFVPAVRELLDRRAEGRETLRFDDLKGTQSRMLPRLVGRTSWLARKAPVWVVVISVGLGGLGLFGVSRLEARFSFLDFVPTTSPLRDTFETLLERFAGGFGERTQVLIEGDVTTAEAWNAMVQANANMADTENIVIFADNPAADSPLAVVRQLVAPESPTFSPQVARAADAAGMNQNLQVVPGGSVAAFYEAAFAVAPDEMSRVLHRSGSGSYDAALFDITTQAGEAGAGRLRDDLLTDFEPVVSIGLSAVATSNEIISDVIVTTLQNSQLQSLLYTLAAALVLLVLNFLIEARRPMLGVITTIPVVLVVLWAFAIMAALGIPFGPITATISALAIGIGIPYMIHITHRYLEDRIRYTSAAEAIESTLTHTGGALAGSALTTVAGFGILVTSTTIPFRQFGFVTSYTILLALLAAILLLPSYLALWDRYHRRRADAVVDEEALAGALEIERIGFEATKLEQTE